MKKNIQIPIATEINHQTRTHGDLRVDPYHWLEKKTDKKVLEHLKNENEYFTQKMRPLEKLKKKTI